MQFEWDRGKAASNRRKHGISFADATVVFADPHAAIFADADHSALEHPEIIVGRSQNRLLVISFTERHDIIRIISARRASARERKRYEENRP
jgi:uncharacterized DUF497 family protein